MGGNWHDLHMGDPYGAYSSSGGYVGSRGIFYSINSSNELILENNYLIGTYGGASIRGMQAKTNNNNDFDSTKEYWCCAMDTSDFTRDTNFCFHMVYTSFCSRETGTDYIVFPVFGVGRTDTDRSAPTKTQGRWNYYLPINYNGAYSKHTVGKYFKKGLALVTPYEFPESHFVGMASAKLTWSGSLAHCDLGVKSVEDLGAIAREDQLMYWGRRDYIGWLQNTYCYIPAGLEEYVTCTADAGYYIRLTNDKTGKKIIIGPGETKTILISKNPAAGDVYNFTIEESATAFNDFTFSFAIPTAWQSYLSFTENFPATSKSLVIDGTNTYYPISITSTSINYTAKENAAESANFKFAFQFNTLVDKTKLTNPVWGLCWDDVTGTGIRMSEFNAGALKEINNVYTIPIYTDYLSDDCKGKLAPCWYISATTESEIVKTDNAHMMIHTTTLNDEGKTIVLRTNDFNFNRILCVPNFSILPSSQTKQKMFFICVKADADIEKSCKIKSYYKDSTFNIEFGKCSKDWWIQLFTMIDGNSIVNFYDIKSTNKIRVNGEWKDAQAKVYVSGAWKDCTAYVYKDGAWHQTL